MSNRGCRRGAGNTGTRRETEERGAAEAADEATDGAEDAAAASLEADAAAGAAASASLPMGVESAGAGCDIVRLSELAVSALCVLRACAVQ